MRKIISVLLACCLVLCVTACSSDSSPKEITVAEAGYTCEALVNYGEDISANVFLKVAGGGIFSVKVNTPEEIAGLTFNFDREDMTVSYNGLENAEGYSEQYGGFSDILNGVFLKITTSSLTVPRQEDRYIYEGQSDLLPFTLTFNEQGFPLELTVPDAELTATFSGWQY